MERHLQDLDLLKIGPLDIVVYHVGGDDGSGPIGALFEMVPNAIFVVFEIRDDAAPVSVTQADDETRQIRIKVNRAVDGDAGTKKFYVTNRPKSSSLLKPSPMALKEDPGFTDCRTWGDNTKIEKVLTVETSSIQQIIEELGLPAPDIISSDAQGAELKILKGAGRFLDNALGVVTEVEFSEVYHHQPLFDDQMTLLGPKGFRLVNLLNMQVWHPIPRMRGMGFLTVSEAIFVKYFHAFASGEDRPLRGYVDITTAPTTTLLKMCIIAMGFRMISYALKIAQYVKAERKDYQQYMRTVPMLDRAFEMLKTFEEHEQNPDRPVDFYIGAIQFPDSVFLRNAAADSSTVYKAEYARGLLLQQAIDTHLRGDLAEAKRLYDLVLAESPNTFDARHMLGVMAMQNGNAAEAISTMNEAFSHVVEHRRYVPAYINRGVAYKSLGYYAEALMDFDKALQLGGPRPDALLNRGISLLNLQRQADALSDFDIVIALEKTSADAYYHRALALAGMKRRPEAIESLKKALQLSPAHAEAKAKLAELS